MGPVKDFEGCLIPEVSPLAITKFDIYVCIFIYNGYKSQASKVSQLKSVSCRMQERARYFCRGTDNSRQPAIVTKQNTVTNASVSLKEFIRHGLMY